jgi:RNA polymerase sigma-70 factor (ECF subfamily)
MRLRFFVRSFRVSLMLVPDAVPRRSNPNCPKTIRIGGIPTMGYNKAKAFKEWMEWKEAEEKKLRSLGVSEDVILRLRKSDLEAFNTERRFWERYAEVDSTYFDWQAADEVLPDIRTAQDLLDDIDSEALLRVLMTVDKLTLQIALWKMEGYSSAEISTKSGLSVSRINFRIWHLRQKIKNIL